MRNEVLAQLDGLVGEWKLTMTNAWFLESLDVKGEGSATIQWLGEAFLEMRATFGEDYGTWHWVVGRSDAREQLALLHTPAVERVVIDCCGCGARRQSPRRGPVPR